jgi:sugar phosphate isomerase/epimerase
MSMKVSMHNWMRPEPIQATIERLARLGYDGLEISGEPQGFDTEQVRSLLDERGLECWGAVTLMTGGRDLLHEDPYVRLGSVQYVKDCLSFVAALDGKIVTVVPSTVGKIVPMASPEDEWRWAVEGLQECQAHAEEVGVRIGLEPLNRFETYFLNRCDQALALADAVGGNCGVALDTFHMNIEESDLLEAIRAAGDRLVDFHVADNNRMPPGYGALDWDAIARELQGIGYEGHLTVEFVPALDRAAEIGDASEAGGGASIEKFLRDHATGAVPEALYERYTEESIGHLRAALGAAV